MSYADFITLLFAFFVVMYATSNNDLEKQKSFQDSVRSELHLHISGGPGLSNSPNSEQENSAIKEALKQLERPIEDLPQKPSGREIVDFLERKISNSKLPGSKLAINEIKHEWLGVRVSLAASTFFDPGSYKLKMSSLEILDDIIKDFKGKPLRLIIEGHTDSDPIKTPLIESNWELSSLRSTSVVRYLIKYHGFQPGMITAAAYGDTRPTAPNTSPENKQKNRRIDILIIADDRINANGI